MPRFESFTPAQENDLDRKTRLESQAAVDCIRIWGELEKGETPALPADKETAERYQEKLEYLKEHARREYDPEEKKALHERADAYIEQLKEIQ